MHVYGLSIVESNMRSRMMPYKGVLSGILPYASIVVLLKAQAKNYNSTRQTPPKPMPTTPNYPQPRIMIGFSFLYVVTWGPHTTHSHHLGST